MSTASRPPKTRCLPSVCCRQLATVPQPPATPFACRRCPTRRRQLPTTSLRATPCCLWPPFRECPPASAYPDSLRPASSAYCLAPACGPPATPAHALPAYLLRADGLDARTGPKWHEGLQAGTCGLVAMTSAQHAEGRQFDPGQVYCLATRNLASAASRQAQTAFAVTPEALPLGCLV